MDEWDKEKDDGKMTDESEPEEEELSEDDMPEVPEEEDGI